MSLTVRDEAAEPVSKARLRLWLKLLKSSRLIEDHVRSGLRSEFKTTLPRFDVMSALSRHPDGLKMTQISALLRVSNGNVTGIVDRLVEDGLALRVAVQGDRRASRVRLTRAGLAAFERQAEAHETWINDIMAEFNAEEADDVVVRLDRLTRTLEQGDS